MTSPRARELYRSCLELAKAMFGRRLLPSELRAWAAVYHEVGDLLERRAEKQEAKG